MLILLPGITIPRPQGCKLNPRHHGFQMLCSRKDITAVITMLPTAFVSCWLPGTCFYTYRVAVLHTLLYFPYTELCSTVL